MVHAGEGYRFHVTGLTHDERGYPAMNAETQDNLVRRLLRQDRAAGGRAARCSRPKTLEDADVVVVSYGITSRVAQRAIADWRATQGMRVGKFRLITAWPFPEPHIARAGRHASRPSWCRS